MRREHDVVVVFFGDRAVEVEGEVGVAPHERLEVAFADVRRLVSFEIRADDLDLVQVGFRLLDTAGRGDQDRAHPQAQDRSRVRKHLGLLSLRSQRNRLPAGRTGLEQGPCHRRARRVSRHPQRANRQRIRLK